MIGQMETSIFKYLKYKPFDTFKIFSILLSRSQPWHLNMLENAKL